MDIFLVGGGACGERCSDSSGSALGSNGGCSGYTYYNKKPITIIVGNRELNINIGAGGQGSYSTGIWYEAAGGDTTIVYNNKIYKAEGGGQESVRKGGSGGGGGIVTDNGRQGYGGKGGSNGNDGENGIVYNTSDSGNSGSKGQGVTTKAFGKTNGTLYAGAGSGGSFNTWVVGGGSRVGGNGGLSWRNESGVVRATNSANNTGGGGGGPCFYESGSYKNALGGNGRSGIPIVRFYRKLRGE